MFYLLSRTVSTASGALYPAYASYKAIKSNDIQQLETWLMFWCVMGAVTVLEHSVEWIVSWFPFYYEIKTLVILWLTLPQIQGSTYIYVAHLEPFLRAHERDIDDAVADAQGKVRRAGWTWINTAVHKLRELLIGGVLASSAGDEQSGAQPRRPPSQPPPPYDHRATSGPASQQPPQTAGTGGFYSLAGNVLRQYAPAALAAGTALLRPMEGRSGAPPHASTSATGASTSASSSTRDARAAQMRSLGVQQPSSLHESAIASSSGRDLSTTTARRRRQAELEAELAALNAQSSMSSPSPSDASLSSSISHRSSSSSLSPPYQAQSGQSSQHQRMYAHVGGHPRSASAGPLSSPVPPPPSAAAAAAVGASTNSMTQMSASTSASGFEEIRRDEVEGAAAAAAVGDGPPVVPGKRLSTGVGSAGWWRWSQPGAADVKTDKKRA